jgi:O-acetyl-ADP-ribose deacetylase (regulator of RNase III)
MNASLRYRIGKESFLELVQGDITNETTAAIVNAANTSLLGGGGVDGAIHRAAGPTLRAECRKVLSQRGPMMPGHAVVTFAGNLKAEYVIHTVGPVWNGGWYNEPQILESCYSNSMEEANRKGCTSVSFPSISTGAYRYPVKAAARVALRAVASLLHQPGTVTLVRFVLFDSDTHKAYAEAAEELVAAFPNFQIVREAVS